MPTSNEAEWLGIRRAIEEVSIVQYKLQNEGLSQVSFFLGVTNVGVTGFILGRFPEHVWLLYVAKSSLLIPAWFVEVSRRYHGALFILDYCWVINILLAAYMMALCAIGPSLGHELRRLGFLWFYASALGPLSWACLALHNGLIFHSVEKTASLFIHFTPNMVAWTLRWQTDIVSLAWPDRFPKHTLEMSQLGELYLVGFGFYFVWLLLHALWLLTIGVDCPSYGHETVFNSLYKKHDLASKFGKWFGCTGGVRCHAAIYLALHGVSCVVAFAWSLLCYRFFWVHTVFAAVLFISAAWAGSGYYTYLFAGIYSRALAKLIPSDLHSSCSDEVKMHLSEGTGTIEMKSYKQIEMGQRQLSAGANSENGQLTA